MTDFTNVNIKVGNNTQQLKMEKGVVFENNGGKYTIDANGQLMKFDKKSNVWVQAKQIEMTKYQWKAFQNLSDNDGQVGTYSKRDIQLAQAKYRKSGFTADMQQDLPAGYRIESSKLNSAEGSVQVHIAHEDIKNSNATLKFQIAELADLKAASEAYQADKAQGAQQTHKSNNSSQVKGDSTVISLNDKDAEIYTEGGVGYNDDTGEEFDMVKGFTATKGRVTSYYNDKKELIGSKEHLPDGRTKYSDKNGNAVWYVKGKPNKNGRDNPIYIYDKNGKLDTVVVLRQTQYTPQGGYWGIKTLPYDDPKLDRGEYGKDVKIEEHVIGALTEGSDYDWPWDSNVIPLGFENGLYDSEDFYLDINK